MQAEKFISKIYLFAFFAAFVFAMFVFAALFVFAAAFVLALVGAFTFAFGRLFVSTTIFVLAIFASTFVFAVFASVFAGCVFSVVDSLVVDKTEMSPVSAGIASNKAESIKQVAAAMVTFESTVAVPRGPKALLETLLVKSAPASVLPGWSKTLPTKVTQEIKNNV